MNYTLFLSVSLTLVSVAGCGGATAAPDGGPGAADSSSVDSSSVDASATTDAGSDASTSDAGTADAAAVVADTGPGDDADVARCDYVGVDEVIVQCDGRYTFVSHFTSELSSCPPFYGFSPDGAHFDSFDAAIASNTTCDPSCEWHFATSVSRIYCGHRDGYEVLRAEGCADTYRFAEGYPSVEAHDAAHPCP